MRRKSESRNCANVSIVRLSMSGYGRMDLRMTETGEIYVIEANANPNIEYGEDFAESAEIRWHFLRSTVAANSQPGT